HLITHLELLDEVLGLREMAASHHEASGGYREFHRYLSLESPSDKDYMLALDNMKVSTRQYAKKQISWLRNKLLPALYDSNVTEETSHTYLLDATEVEEWNASVRDPAVQIMTAFLNNDVLQDPFSLSDIAKTMLRVDIKPTASIGSA
ncbi:hypothetical protein MPER_05097, partial [Moniliophthora perniciosa FA553]